MIKICKECGKEFETKQSKVIYCNRDHYRFCFVCNKKFLVKSKQSLNIQNLTCSRECSKKKELMTKESSDIKYKSNRRKRQGIRSTCKFCGKEIYKYNSNCIDYCASHKMTCFVCGKEFYLKSRYLNEKSIEENKFVCSRKCGIIKAQDSRNSKEIYEKASNTYYKRTGYKNPWSNPEVKNKAYNKCKMLYGNDFRSKISKDMWDNRTDEDKQKIINKIKNTNLKLYGVDNVYKSPEIRKTSDLTCINRYGKPLKEIALEKSKEASFKKFGVQYYMQHKDFKEKSKVTLIKKYGENYNDVITAKSVAARRKLNNGEWLSQESKNKTIDTNMIRYGVPYTCMHECVNSKNNKTISKVNRNFGNKLKEIGINYKFEQRINGLNYDIMLENKNIVIEIDPTYSHQSTKERIFGGEPKLPIKYDYQQLRTLNAKNNGYQCIHIFDWDDWDKILYMLKPKNKISGHKCKVIEVNSRKANKFLDEYHLQNHCRGNIINLALVNKQTNEILSIATFGKSRYNKNYEYEFLRYASSDYVVQGGITKLWNYFVNNYNPNSVISYCDNAKFDGNFFKYLGFELKSYGEPSCHWYNIKTKKHFTNNLLLQLGADKLLGTNYGKPEECCMNNRDIMIKEGFVEVYDCGQSSYVWNKL